MKEENIANKIKIFHFSQKSEKIIITEMVDYRNIYNQKSY